MRIFISHIHEEANLASVLKEWLESTFADQCTVFVSSDSKDISLGDKWLDRIDQALNDASLLLILCSPTSVSRPWINFEAGCGWIKRVPVIPVCHSGQSRDELASPLSTFQALDLQSADSCKALVESLADRVAIKRLPRISYQEMAAEIEAAAQSIPPDARESKPNDSNTTIRNRHYFLSGCAVGNRIAVLPLPPGTEDDGSLRECLDALSKAGLKDTAPYVKIAKVAEITGEDGDTKEIIEDFFDAMGSLPEVAQQIGSEEEYAWFNLGRILYEIPTLLATGEGESHSVNSALTALELSADHTTLPDKLRDQILQYVQFVRDGADMETTMGKANELSLAIHMFL